MARNVLWIMADQLRFDYLGCYGHPHLETPHIDALAGRGVRFTRAYVQSPICGPSRMSYYTGRYCRSHGSTANGFPLRVGEPTLGDHLAEIGVPAVLVGKTHMKPDYPGMARLGIDRDSSLGVRAAECGFEPFERDDGVHPDGFPGSGATAYDSYLRSKGYSSDNPWNDFANATVGADEAVLNGWLLENVAYPANVAAEDSETAYMTRRAMDFIECAGDGPWCLHLSYIKPHWPYVAPAPYHALYGPDHVLPPARRESETVDPHPVYRAFMEKPFSASLSRDEVRAAVVPVYMGMIKQIDDQLGRLFAFLRERGLEDETLVILCSDHGDYLGDHWLGEKDLFHEPSVRTPLIVVDPRPEADATRGMVRDELVEAIDLAPTVLAAFGGGPLGHILEGRDLTPLLHDPEAPPGWRDHVVSEYDYARRLNPAELGMDQKDARLVMVCDGRWKYVHAEAMRPMLFDLATDPGEFVDLGTSEAAEHRAVRDRLERKLNGWARRHHNRITVSADYVDRIAGTEPPGVHIGFWNQAQIRLHEERTASHRNPTRTIGRPEK